jgi:hypothetical protein
LIPGKENGAIAALEAPMNGKFSETEKWGFRKSCCSRMLGQFSYGEREITQIYMGERVDAVHICAHRRVSDVGAMTENSSDRVPEKEPPLNSKGIIV